MKKFLRLLRGPALFAMVGIVSTSIDIGLFTLLNRTTGLIAGANIVSFCTGMVVAFLMNRRITFRERSGHSPIAHEAARYFVVSGSNCILSTLIVHVAAQSMLPFYAKLLSLPFVFIWGYTFTSRFVFAPKKPKRRAVTSRTAP